MIPVCRKILGREPRCPEFISASVALAAAIAAGVGGTVAGGLALADGVTPWDDPLEFMKRSSIGAGTGGAGSVLGNVIGAALGPSLGMPGGSGGAGGSGGSSGGGGTGGGTGGVGIGAGAGDATAAGFGIGSGTGTVAAESGAALPQNLSGMVSGPAQDILGSVGTRGTQGVIDRAIQQFAPNQAFGNALRDVPRNVISGSITGAARDYEHPGRGLLSGAVGSAASSLASGAFNTGASALFRGQGAGIVPNSDMGPTRGFSMMDGPGGDFGRAYNPSTASSGFDSFMGGDKFGYDPGRDVFSMSRTNIATPPPTLTERVTNFGVKQGSSLAGSAARMGVNNAMRPSQPQDPMSQNPYAQYGRNPYWMRRM